MYQCGMWDDASWSTDGMQGLVTGFYNTQGRSRNTIVKMLITADAGRWVRRDSLCLSSQILCIREIFQTEFFLNKMHWAKKYIHFRSMRVSVQMRVCVCVCTERRSHFPVNPSHLTHLGSPQICPLEQSLNQKMLMEMNLGQHEKMFVIHCWFLK